VSSCPTVSSTAMMIGRSAGIQGRAFSSACRKGTHRSSSWSSRGRGSPSRICALQTLIAAVPLSCQPCSSGPRTSVPSSTSTPNSSRISRRSAASQPSPGSTLPPGNSHRPAKDSGAVLRAAKSSEGFERESRIAAPTICFRGCSTVPSLPTVRRLPGEGLPPRLEWNWTTTSARCTPTICRQKPCAYTSDCWLSDFDREPLHL
jgi:hypothetical protein